MENIHVALRVRPLNPREIERDDEAIWKISNYSAISLHQDHYQNLLMTKKVNSSTKTSFNYDYCFSEKYDNFKVYETVCKKVVMSSLNGINGTIFMYGQTGSGKTFTMMGYNKTQNFIDEIDKLSAEQLNRSKAIFPDPAEGLKAQQQADPMLRNIYEKTMAGNTGILLLALRDLFNAIESDLEKTYILRCSYVEIYNDNIYDLLKNKERLGETLTINEDTNKQEFYIKGVTEESVSTINEILEKLRKGETNRHYASTVMNHSSSRSHTIFQLNVQTVTNNFIRNYRKENTKRHSNINNQELMKALKVADGGADVMEEEGSRAEATAGSIVTESLLNFVDLAGSEKVSNHHMMVEEFTSHSTRESISSTPTHMDSTTAISNKMKDRIKEGQHINKSLFFLTQVISLKSEGKSNVHIPYRNSPLTKILRSSLGGNSRTLIILCITPALSQFEQTMSTLRFGTNAKKIENKIHANIITNNDDEAIRILMSEFEKKIRDLENWRTEDKGRIDLLEKKIEELVQKIAALKERLLKKNLNNYNSFRKKMLTLKEKKSFVAKTREEICHFKKCGILFNKSCSQKGLKLPDLEKEQALIYDSEGKFALVCLRRAKEQTRNLKKKIDVMENNFTEINKAHLKTFEELLEASKKNKKMQEILQLLIQKYVTASGVNKSLRDHLENVQEQNIRLNDLVDLYKDGVGIEGLSDEELLKMEECLYKGVDRLKEERCGRKFEAEIKELKRKLNLPAENSSKGGPQASRNAADRQAMLYEENFTVEDIKSILDSKSLFGEDSTRENLESDELKNKHLMVEEDKIINMFYMDLEEFDEKMAQTQYELSEMESCFANNKLKREFKQTSEEEDSNKSFLAKENDDLDRFFKEENLSDLNRLINISDEHSKKRVETEPIGSPRGSVEIRRSNTLSEYEQVRFLSPDAPRSNTYVFDSIKSYNQEHIDESDEHKETGRPSSEAIDKNLIKSPSFQEGEAFTKAGTVSAEKSKAINGEKLDERAFFKPRQGRAEAFLEDEPVEEEDEKKRQNRHSLYERDERAGDSRFKGAVKQAAVQNSAKKIEISQPIASISKTAASSSSAAKKTPAKSSKKDISPLSLTQKAASPKVPEKSQLAKPVLLNSKSPAKKLEIYKVAPPLPKAIPKKTHQKTKSLMSHHEMKFQDILTQFQSELKERNDEAGAGDLQAKRQTESPSNLVFKAHQGRGSSCEDECEKECEISKDMQSISEDRRSDHNKFQIDETSIQKEETDFSISTVGNKYFFDNNMGMGAGLPSSLGLNNEELITRLSHVSLMKKQSNGLKEEDMVLLSELNRKSDDEEDDRNLANVSSSRKKRRTRAERLGKKDLVSSDSNN